MEESQIIKGAKIAYFFILLITPITIGTRIFYSRVLSVEEFGLFYAFVGLLTIIPLFTTFGLNNGIIHYTPKLLLESKWGVLRKTLVQIIILEGGLSGLVSILMYLFRERLAQYYFHSSLAVQIIPIFAAMLLLNVVFDFITSFFYGTNREIIYSSMNPLRLAVVLIFSVLAYFLSKNLLFSFSLIWALSFLVVFGYIYLAHKMYPLLFERANSSASYFKKMFNYGIITFLTGGAGVLLSKTDVVMLTFINGVTAVAFYEVVTTIATAILLLFSPLSSFLFPTISKLYHAKSTEMINQILHAVYNLGLYLIIPAVVIIISFSSVIITVLFGENYLPAAAALKFLAVAFLFRAFCGINFVILDGIGQVKKKMYLFYAGAGTNVVLNAILIPFFGLNGAVIATLLSFFIMLMGSSYFLRKSGYSQGLSNWWKIAILNLLLFLEIYLLRMLLDLSLYLEITIIVVVAGATYLALGYITKVIDFKKVFSLFKF